METSKIQAAPQPKSVAQTTKGGKSLPAVPVLQQQPNERDGGQLAQMMHPPRKTIPLSNPAQPVSNPVAQRVRTATGDRYIQSVRTLGNWGGYVEANAIATHLILRHAFLL